MATTINASLNSTQISNTVEGITINASLGQINLSVALGNTVATAPNYVNEGEALRFDGQSGDTYLIYNSTTNRLELWRDGVKKQSW